LLARHHQSGRNLARRITNDEEIARELTQEAMLAAFLSLKSLRQPESFSSWFYGIVLNVCRDYLRTRHANPLSLEALQGGLYYEHDSLARRIPDPQAITEARELHDLIMQAAGHHPGILVIRRDNDPKRDMTPRGIVQAIGNLIAAGVALQDQFTILNHWR
jgi:RNA polymerase sigma factor (sigma-70 family)